MEYRPISRKVKSSYLFTLIVSYLGHFEVVVKLIHLLSKSGETFIDNNLQQLAYFCKHYKLDCNINIRQTLIYAAPSIYKLDKLTVISLIEGQHLGIILKKIKTFEKLKIQSDLLSRSYALNEDYPSFLSLIDRCNCFKILHQSPDILFYRFLHKHIENMRSIKKLSMPLFENQLKAMTNLLSLLPELEQISITVLTKIEQKLFQEMLQTVKNHEVEKSFLLSLNYKNQFIPLLETIGQMKSLKGLKLKYKNLCQYDLSILKNINQLESLELEILFFDFNYLSQWSQLKKLKVLCKYYQVTGQDIQKIKNLEGLRIIGQPLMEIMHQSLVMSVQNIPEITLSQLKPSQCLAFLKEANSLIVLNLQQIPFLSLKLLSGVNQLQKLRICSLDFSLQYEMNWYSTSEFQNEIQIEPNLTLEELTLSFYDSLTKSIAHFVHFALIKFISQNLKLKKLKFIEGRPRKSIFISFGNWFDLFDMECSLEVQFSDYMFQSMIAQLGDYMKQNQGKLTSLDLSFSKIDETDLKNLAFGIKENSTLQSLKLKLGQVSVETIELLFQAVKLNGGLQMVSIEHSLDFELLKSMHLSELLISTCSKLRELIFVSIHEQCDSNKKELDKFRNKVFKDIKNNLPVMLIIVL